VDLGTVGHRSTAVDVNDVGWVVGRIRRSARSLAASGGSAPVPGRAGRPASRCRQVQAASV
jgi:hypothetical protein